MVEVLRLPDLQAVIDEAAERFLEVARADGTKHIVLTGGGAGIGLLRKLRDADVDWSGIHLYFGDERNVPVSHEDSNEGQAREALLDHIAIPAENIHGYGLGEVPMEEAAVKLEAILPEHFDLHLMGMGGEGHINSLFPHSQATAEEHCLVVPVEDSPKPPAQRVTLTFPAIARAKRVWLLVAGEEKHEAAQHVIDGADRMDWPAAGAKGQEETLLFLA